MIKTFEIFWGDLTADCQKRLGKFLELEEGDNGNYDVFPVSIFEVEEEALRDGTETCNSN